VTYSIVARDPESVALGVAVQTGTFGVGRGVPWAEAGLGAVATQSYTERSYGPLGLELMRADRSAAEALDGLVAADADQAVRQVAMVDASGLAAAHTGASCIRECGHLVADGYSVQANMMRSDRVWPAMAEAYEGASGSLARRLLSALQAAEAAGGDFRGPQSAALLVVQGEPTGNAWKGTISDLRVDDHDDPLGELERLLGMEEAYLALRDADSGRPGLAAPLREKDRIWEAALEAAHEGDPDRARSILQPLFAAEPNWRDAVRSSGERGEFPGWERVLEGGG
jgi:uncharacterized Ntn-hydrolase superfamily protein